ncbi:SETMR methyltransferase, partial [Pseudoatta argentina]
MSLKTRKKKSKRILPTAKCGGVLPVLPLLGILKTVNDNKAAQRQLDELQRHNHVMEVHGIYLAPYMRGRSVTNLDNAEGPIRTHWVAYAKKRNRVVYFDSFSNLKLGKSASETFRSMQQVYGSQCLGRTAVFEWHKRFLEGRETLEDDKKSGRPILVRTPEMIEKVRDFVANDRNASLKMMEEALNISRETIRTILYEDLVCAKFVPHTLRSDQKSARINYSRDIVAAENNPNFLKSIVTGDETWCFRKCF